MENLSKDIYDYLKSKFPLNHLTVEIKKNNANLDDKVKYISTIYDG